MDSMKGTCKYRYLGEGVAYRERASGQACRTDVEEHDERIRAHRKRIMEEMERKVAGRGEAYARAHGLTMGNALKVCACGAETVVVNPKHMGWRDNRDGTYTCDRCREAEGDTQEVC